MPLYQIGSLKPQVAPTAWIAPTAQLIGNVRVEARASIWFGAVLRADNDFIHIGEGSNVQDNTTMHIDDGSPLIIGQNVTVGHHAMLHGCEIGNNTLVGMSATLLSRSRIGQNCIVAAGSLIPEGKIFPDNVLIMGAPAKIVREITEKDLTLIQHGAAHYQDKGLYYAQELQEI